jgi:hypothetical protein
MTRISLFSWLEPRVRRASRYAWTLLIAAWVLSFAAEGRACPGFIPIAIPPAVPPPPFVAGSNCDTTCHLPADLQSSRPRNSFATAWAASCLSGCDGAGHCGGCVPSYWGENGCLVVGDADNDTFLNDEEIRFVPPTNPSVAGDVNECVVGVADCVGASTCSDASPARNSFTCDCPPGYAGDGRLGGDGCQNIDECDEEEGGCVGGSTCVDNDGGYVCECPGGLGSVFPGDECPDTDLCDPNPCSSLSTCVFAEGAALCRICEAGYAGDPNDCVACPAGYEGDGQGGDGCLDIDECAQGDGPCYPGVTCTNTEGAFGCGACPLGFHGSGLGPTGCVSDECRACSPFARCTPGAAQPCTCNRGFEPDAETGECEDIDECAGGLARCATGSHCENIPGSFVCECDAGFRILAGGCTQTTCETWNQTCGEGAACDDSSGIPTCICVAGASTLGSGPSGGPSPGPGSSELARDQRSGGQGRGWLVAGLFVFFGLLLSSSRGSRAVLLGGLSRAKRLAHAASLLSLLCLLAALLLQSGCGDDEPAASAGGSSGSVMAGSGGGTASSGSGGGGSGGDNPSGGAGGTASETGASLDCALTGGTTGSPAITTCADSRDCSADRWCNPASNACEARETGEAISFREISSLLRTLDCTTCHLPGGPGAIATGGSGDPLILDDQENFHQSYASLVGAGVSCAGGLLERVCVDDPASSRLVSKVFDNGDATITLESIAFTSWTDEGLQTILRWIARGAPRDPPCGNYIVDAGEQCDLGPTPDTRCPYSVNPTTCQLCTSQCVFAPATGPSCGDSTVNAPFETCDDGNQLLEQVPPNGAPVCGRSCTFEGGIPAG